MFAQFEDLNESWKEEVEGGQGSDGESGLDQVCRECLSD